MSLKQDKLNLLKNLYEAVNDYEVDIDLDMDSSDYIALCQFTDEIRAKVEEMENQLYTDTVVEERYG